LLNFIYNKLWNLIGNLSRDWLSFVDIQNQSFWKRNNIVSITNYGKMLRLYGNTLRPYSSVTNYSFLFLFFHKKNSRNCSKLKRNMTSFNQFNTFYLKITLQHHKPLFTRTFEGEKYDNARPWHTKLGSFSIQKFSDIKNVP
jgi:hypothetical protein